MPRSRERFARQHRCRPPPGFPRASPWPGIAHRLSGPTAATAGGARPARATAPLGRCARNDARARVALGGLPLPCGCAALARAGGVKEKTTPPRTRAPALGARTRPPCRAATSGPMSLSFQSAFQTFAHATCPLSVSPRCTQPWQTHTCRLTLHSQAARLAGAACACRGRARPRVCGALTRHGPLLAVEGPARAHA